MSTSINVQCNVNSAFLYFKFKKKSYKLNDIAAKLTKSSLQTLQQDAEDSK